MDQLKTTFRALGTPTEEEWPVRASICLHFFLGLSCLVVRSNRGAPFFLIVPFSLHTFMPPLTTPQGHTKLPDYVSVGQFPRTPLRDLFTAASGDTLNLLSKCIIYEPRKRISARDVRSPPLLNLQLHVLISLAGSQPPLLFRTPIPYTPLEAPENCSADGRCRRRRFSTSRRSRWQRRPWCWRSQ